VPGFEGPHDAIERARGGRKRVAPEDMV